MYPNVDPAHLLLGCEYVLLRDEFQPFVTPPEIPSMAQNILITLGGADPHSTVVRIIEALTPLEIPEKSLLFVVGEGKTTLCRNASAALNSNVEIRKNVEDMPALMRWADLAISAAGTTTWELAFMGVPSLLIAIAENQRPIAAELARRGISHYLGWHEDLKGLNIRSVLTDYCGDLTKRRKMSMQGRTLVDGKGGERITQVLLTKCTK